MSLTTLGWSPFFEEQLSDDDPGGWGPARVVWQGRGAYRLSSGVDEWRAELSGRLRYKAASRARLPTVGDWVLAESGTIHRLLTRRSAFSRKAAGPASGEQIVAANVDTVLLVTSLNRDFNPRRLERYLMMAWESGANPIIVLNKADLSGDPRPLRMAAESVASGVGLLVTSAVRGDGLEELSQAVREGGTTALLGSSGVGKSSLINVLLGDARQSALDIRDRDDRGRHSTTARQLFMVPTGGVLIDTPGMRELQLWDAEDGLEHAFGDVTALAEACRFRDCSHQREPGCAVTAAVAAGVLDAARLDSYHRLKREERYLRAREEQGPPERGRSARAGSRAIKQLYKLRRR